MQIIAKQFLHTALSGFQPTGRVPYFDEHTQCWTEQFGRFQRQDPPSVYKYTIQENHTRLHRYRIKKTVQFMF